MKDTLYQQIRDIERMDKVAKVLNGFTPVNKPELERKLCQDYERNPVFKDAIDKKQTIEQSLEELGKIRKGIRGFLPWRKNKAHNERVKQIGELIFEPHRLYTLGIFTPDNIITTGAGLTAASFGIFYLMTKLFINPSPEVLYQYRVILPAVLSVYTAPIAGVASNLLRFIGLPTDEAKYLDEKVKEFYK